MTVDPQNSFTLRRGIELRRTPLDDLMAAIMDARVRVWIASPFVGGAVAEEVREHLADLRGAGRKLDLRGLTNLNRGALIGGFSSVDGLPALLGAGVTMRAASNLHAKIIVVDRRFALVGSANLTSPGRGAGDRNNAELGVIFTTPADVDRVADVFSSCGTNSDRASNSPTRTSKGSRP